jgi:riboflavin synthase
MFTGIIEDIGKVAALEVGSGGARLGVETRLASGDRSHIRLGDSIAVMGACLTVTRHDKGALDFDVSLESLARTNLGALEPGARVHLERALVLGGRLDGHLVQGHVDGVARLVTRERAGDGWLLGYELPAPLLPQVVEKGSIALDGVSLTVASLVGARVAVAVVPHTARHTVLVDTPIGRAVNVETDILGKYVERMLTLGRGGKAGPSGIDLDFLAEHGFAR